MTGAFVTLYLHFSGEFPIVSDLLAVINLFLTKRSSLLPMKRSPERSCAFTVTLRRCCKKNHLKYIHCIYCAVETQVKYILITYRTITYLLDI